MAADREFCLPLGRRATKQPETTVGDSIHLAQICSLQPSSTSSRLCPR
jgi:hypothetical protein